MKSNLFKKYKLLPLRSNKAPAVSTWSLESDISFSQIENSEYIGLMCGHEGIEVIDIDNHFGDADELFSVIYNNYDLELFPIIKTKGGGYHIYFRSQFCEGNKKLAMRVNSAQRQETLVETRGKGGYVVCPPSPGYEIIQGNLLNIPELSDIKRTQLLMTCRALNEVEVKSEPNKIDSSTDKPGDVYNSDISNFEATKTILRNHGWKSNDDKHWTRPGKEAKDGISATFGKVGVNKFYVFSSNAYPFEMQTSYSMFAVKAMLDFGGDYSACAKSLIDKPKSNHKPKKNVEIEVKEEDDESYEYIRIGDNYYKNINTVDKNGNEVRRLVRRSRQTLLDDYGKTFLETVTKFDDFCNVPSHTNYRPVIGKCYNMYHSVNIEPSKKECRFETIKKFMLHIFREHLELGYDYIQLLWSNPTQILPVLCLVSEENQTGKTTFGNFLNAIFGHNFVSIGQSELTTEFNGSYASRLIAMVDESWISYKVIDKLKYMATTPFIMLRQMHKDHTPIDFFCKFILCSNRVDDFIIANENDERYWVRKISRFGDFDPNFLEKLIKEIPCFLNYLSSRQLSVPNEARAYFAPYRLRTKAFENLIQHSKDVSVKEILETIIADMELNENNTIYCTCKDLKEAFFERRNEITITKIKDTLQKELKLLPAESPGRYRFTGIESKIGRYYTIEIEQLKRALNITYQKEHYLNEKIDLTPREGELLF